MTPTTAVLAVVCGGMLLAQPPAKPRPPLPSTYAQRVTSSDNMKKVGLAMFQHWADDEAKGFPQDYTDAAGKPLLSWRVRILPQLDQQFLFDQFKKDEPWDSDHNKKLLPYMPKVFRTVGWAGSDTFVKQFRGPTAVFAPGKVVSPVSIGDGSSNTLLVVEAGPAVPWTKPVDIDYDAKGPLPAMDGPFADRFHAAFADGHVAPVRWNLPEQTYRRLIETNDGQPVSGDISPPPAKAVTKQEKEEVERLKKFAADRVTYLDRLSGERERLIGELARTGGVPPEPPLPDDAGVEQWRAEMERLSQRERLMRDEVERLRAAVQARKR
jgi:prepilin-type processing-associated H-X9-DG protein